MASTLRKLHFRYLSRWSDHETLFLCQNFVHTQCICTYQFAVQTKWHYIPAINCFHLLNLRSKRNDTTFLPLIASIFSGNMQEIHVRLQCPVDLRTCSLCWLQWYEYLAVRVSNLLQCATAQSLHFGRGQMTREFVWPSVHSTSHFIHPI